MIIKVIFGQRKQDYEGQNAPEALECMTEYDYDDNPEWLENKLKAHMEDKSFISVRIIDVDVDGDRIYDILTKTPSIDGDVQE